MEELRSQRPDLLSIKTGILEEEEHKNAVAYMLIITCITYCVTSMTKQNKTFISTQVHRSTFPLKQIADGGVSAEEHNLAVQQRQTLTEL